MQPQGHVQVHLLQRVMAVLLVASVIAGFISGGGGGWARGAFAPPPLGFLAHHSLLIPYLHLPPTPL